MRAYAKVMSRYAVFRGRASRGEFWGFFLVYMIIGLIVVIADQSLIPVETPGSGILTGIFGLVHLLPGMAVLIRRLHDIDRTGWWVLINITGIGFFVLLIMAALEGTDGPNRYGSDPHHARDGSYDDRHRQAGRGDDRREYRQRPGHEPSFEFDPQGPHAAAKAPPARSTRSGDLIGELERLSKLKADGALSEPEYEVLKAQALSRGSLA